MKFLKFNDGVAMFSELTKTPYDTALFKLGRVDRPPVTDFFGNLDLQKFRDRATESHVSGSAICDKVSKLTGSSYENVYLEMNRIRIKR